MPKITEQPEYFNCGRTELCLGHTQVMPDHDVKWYHKLSCFFNGHNPRTFYHDDRMYDSQCIRCGRWIHCGGNTEI